MQNNILFRTIEKKIHKTTTTEKKIYKNNIKIFLKFFDFF